MGPPKAILVMLLVGVFLGIATQIFFFVLLNPLVLNLLTLLSFMEP
jgi:hypothetical protein